MLVPPIRGEKRHAATINMNPPVDTQKKRVFLVDDHPLVREWLTNLINQQPDLTVCGEADTAPRALEAIAQARPDVAIVDLSLKDSSGFDLIKNLKQSETGAAVLVLSMHDEAHYAERALRAGARGYVMKRETTKKVVNAIRRVLEGRVYISDSISEAMTARLLSGSADEVSASVEQLSDRELEVFEMLGRGLGTRQIAETLRVSVKTIQAYCARIKEKLHLDSATELLREAIRWNEARHQR